jgi:hypothetical protein
MGKEVENASRKKSGRQKGSGSEGEILTVESGSGSRSKLSVEHKQFSYL